MSNPPIAPAQKARYSEAGRKPGGGQGSRVKPAKTVSVVGDWNAWDPNRDRLRDPNGDGTWEITLRLRKGEDLRYQFLIDGERWVADPQALLQVDDGFGGTSSVLQI